MFKNDRKNRGEIKEMKTHPLIEKNCTNGHSQNILNEESYFIVLEQYAKKKQELRDIKEKLVELGQNKVKKEFLLLLQKKSSEGDKNAIVIISQLEKFFGKEKFDISMNRDELEYDNYITRCEYLTFSQGFTERFLIINKDLDFEITDITEKDELFLDKEGEEIVDGEIDWLIDFFYAQNNEIIEVYEKRG